MDKVIQVYFTNNIKCSYSIEFIPKKKKCCSDFKGQFDDTPCQMALINTIIDREMNTTGLRRK